MASGQVLGQLGPARARLLTGTATPADQYNRIDARHPGIPWFQLGNFEDNQGTVPTGT